MINLAVINLKDIINFFRKIIFGIILGIITIIIVLKCVGNIKKGNYINIEDLKHKSILECSHIIDKTLLISTYYNDSDVFNESGIKKVLVSELAILATEEELMEKENQEEIIEFENINNEIKDEKDENKDSSTVTENNQNSNLQDTNNIAEISTTLPTRILSENNKVDKYTDVYKNVKIKNESKYQLTEEMVTPNIDFTNKKDIIIYHTHTCESYTPTEQNNYQATGNFRTTDLNYNVARVGTELSNHLIGMGFNIKHDVTYHDYPAYTGSYTRALSTIKNIVSNNSAELIIDLHRDALGSNSNYAPSVQIGDEVAAQLMFVIGTDGGGLEHTDWLKNLKFAIKIQEKAEEMYPGLFKPIILRNSRYNQHIADGACIIEVGATGNTLEQCNSSMKYLSKVIEEIIK